MHDDAAVAREGRPRRTRWSPSPRGAGAARRPRRGGRATRPAGARRRGRPARGRCRGRRSGRRGRPTPGRRPASSSRRAGSSRVRVRSHERERLDHLADARHPGPAADAGRTARRPRAGRPRSRSEKPAQRSTAAASAEPPPRPAPAGIRFSSRTWAVRPARARARRDQVVVALGTPRPAPVVPSTSSRPSPGVEHERVGQVEGDHLGVDQVVAVVADPGDPQRRGSAWPGRRGRRAAAGSDTTCSHGSWASDGGGERAPLHDAELLGTGLGCARRRRRRPPAATRPASDRRSILRRWPNAVRTSPMSGLRDRRRPPARRSRVRRTSTTLDLGLGDEDAWPAPCPPPRRWPTAPPSPTGCRRPRCREPAARRSPTSRWTMTSMRSMAGTSSSRSSTIGVATL